MFLIVLAFIVCIGVGFLTGSTGVGGIILIPALTLLLGLPTHDAMSIALASFIVAAIHITVLYYRRGMVSFPVVIPFTLGGVLMAYFGALAKTYVQAPSLTIALAGLILLSAFNILKPKKENTKKSKWAYDFANAPKKQHNTFLFILGSFVGFIAGLTGVGGSIISIPIMIYFGFSPLCSIVAGQAFIILVSMSGTIGNAIHGHIDWFTVLWVTIGQMLGIFWGVRMACKTPTEKLQKIVAIVCIILAILLLLTF